MWSPHKPRSSTCRLSKERVSWGSELLTVQNTFWIQVSEIINWVSHDTRTDEWRNTLIGCRLCSFSSFSPAAQFCWYSSRKALVSSTVCRGWSVVWSMRQSAWRRQIGHGQCDLTPLIRAITHLSTYYVSWPWCPINPVPLCPIASMHLPPVPLYVPTFSDYLYSPYIATDRWALCLVHLLIQSLNMFPFMIPVILCSCSSVTLQKSYFDLFGAYINLLNLWL